MIDLETNTPQEKNNDSQERTFEETREDNSGSPSGAQTPPDTISRLLLERDYRPLQPQAGKEDPSRGLDKRPDPKPELSQEDDKTPDLEIFKREAEKVRGELESTKKWGHANSQKLKKAMVQTKEFIENGDLSEEEGQRLIEILQASSHSSSTSSFEEEGDLGDDKNPNPFVKIFKIANGELENIRKYTDDPLLQEKINAFDYFTVVMATSEEREALLEEFQDLLTDPLQLTKKMLSVGKTCYEDSYRDIQEAGGLKGYLSKKDTEIDKLTKTIDKLSKKLAQYEDYDRPTYGLKEMGLSEEKHRFPIDTITGLFAERDRPVVRR